MGQQTQPVNVVRIIMQCSTRMDSLTALYLLQKTEAGRRMFPGAESAEIGLWGRGSQLIEGLDWKQHLEKGTVLIGVGGGPFDEHPSDEFGDRKDGQCSATLLVAKHLGLDQSSIYRDLVRMTTDRDLNPVDEHDVMANVVKLMHRSGTSISEIIAWATMGLDALVTKQIQFREARDSILKDAHIEFVDSPQGECRVVFVRSDNCYAWAGARYRKDLSIAALIQQDSRGNVRIFSNGNLGVDLQKVVKEVRRAELYARGEEEVAARQSNRLGDTGTLSFLDNWHYMMPGNALMNGSETACDIEPTRIPYKRIFSIVRDNILFEGRPQDPPVIEARRQPFRQPAGQQNDRR